MKLIDTDLADKAECKNFVDLLETEFELKKELKEASR